MSSDSILVRVPSKPDYISMARLSTSCVGNNIGLNIDEIEDIKVSIGEACINSLSITNDKSITIEFLLLDNKLEIKVSGVKENVPNDIEEKQERELGILIIKSLMDEVEFNDYGILMSKFIE